MVSGSEENDSVTLVLSLRAAYSLKIVSVVTSWRDFDEVRRVLSAVSHFCPPLELNYYSVESWVERGKT